MRPSLPRHVVPISGNGVVVLTGAAGVGLLAYLVFRLGPERIAAQIHGLSAVFPLVLLLTGLKYPLQAAGWRLALPASRRPPWWESIASTIAGDALGYLTWAGPFTGEPTRALLTRGRVPIAESVAAGAAERTVYNATAAALVWGVLVHLLWRAHPIGIAMAVVATALLIVWLVRLIRRARRGLAAHDVTAPHTPHGPSTLTRAFVELLHIQPTRLSLMGVLCLAQHALLVGEAYVLLRALGAPPSLQDALVFEAVTKIVNTAGVLVPARIGVSEGGSAILARALGYSASHGVSLALMRRVRAITWAAVGLAVLPFQETRARHDAQRASQKA